MSSKNFQSLEFERKFSYTSETEAKLLEYGARSTIEQLLTDVYYDTNDYILTTNDHWLRHRNGHWELKYRPTQPYNDNHDQLVSQYREETDENRIIDLVSCLLADDRKLSPEVSLTDSIANDVSNTFHVLAAFKSRRVKYVIDDGLVIDLDETDFGLRVGEIEMVINGHVTDDKATVVRQKINDLAMMLGITNQKIDGKLENYLATRNPELYRELLDKKIFTPIPTKKKLQS